MDIIKILQVGWLGKIFKFLDCELHELIQPANANKVVGINADGTALTIADLPKTFTSNTVSDIVEVVDSNVTVDYARVSKCGNLCILYVRMTFTSAKDYSNAGILNLKSPYTPLGHGNLGRIPVSHSSNMTSPLYCQRNDLALFVYRFSSYKNVYMYGSVQAGETIQFSVAYSA